MPRKPAKRAEVMPILWPSKQRLRIPLPDEKMRALFNDLDAALRERGCDHTLGHLRAWAEGQGVSFEEAAAWCRENGGYCDCEVLLNCEVKWQAARKDPNAQTWVH